MDEIRPELSFFAILYNHSRHTFVNTRAYFAPAAGCHLIIFSANVLSPSPQRSASWDAKKALRTATMTAIEQPATLPISPTPCQRPPRSSGLSSRASWRARFTIASAALLRIDTGIGREQFGGAWFGKVSAPAANMPVHLILSRFPIRVAMLQSSACTISTAARLVGCRPRYQVAKEPFEAARPQLTVACATCAFPSTQLQRQPEQICQSSRCNSNAPQ